MLLPDNIRPELSLYYNGAIILNALKFKPKQSLIDLFKNTKKENDISFSLFLLSLDWLYLIDVVTLDDNGEVELCL